MLTLIASGLGNPPERAPQLLQVSRSLQAKRLRRLRAPFTAQRKDKQTLVFFILLLGILLNVTYLWQWMFLALLGTEFLQLGTTVQNTLSARYQLFLPVLKS